MDKKVVDIAVAIIFNRKNQVLITKRNNKQSFAGLWEFPGGKIETGEIAKDAAIREVHEEVCIDLTLSDTRKYHQIMFETDTFIANISYYKATHYVGTPKLTDQLDMKWVNVKDLYKYQFPKANDEVLAMLEADDKLINPNLSYPIQQSKLIHNYVDSNNQNHKVLTTIIDKLLEADSFKIVVAFATTSGVSMLLPTLKQLEKRNIQGQIVVGTYLQFTDPVAINKLNSFENIEVFINNESNLHAKGYLFEQANNTDVLIGSSNLTSSALTTNIEWNTLTTYSNNDVELIDIQNQFNAILESSQPASDLIEEYTELYNANKAVNKQKQELYNSLTTKSKQEPITANKMQIEALNSLSTLRTNGIDKGLVVSSTGSGKTILAALDVKQANPSRLLFVVHRENIARKALETFQKIIPNKSYGLYTGSSKDMSSDYIFATIQSLVNNLDQMAEDSFDYIIIDEVHHGGAPSYQTLFKQTNPSFYLGLTATPERSDGFNIFEMFDYNIAYEYRLDRAMKDNLLSPFHYFGVSDITVDNKRVDEKTTINDLTTDERIKNISQKLKEYTVTEQVNGLMFVSNIKEAKLLSSKLNELGYKTITLDSSNSEEERQQAIDNLETTNLDYIITVDIFNEGIDIPCVNQVVLLRPTKSAIVYIQQIGRGLRKYKDKEFVTIIDFIGNYKNNYLVPVAIANDHTYNKDTLKKDIIINGITAIPGASVIQFEQIVQDELIKQITNTKISTMARVKQDYEYLNSKLNRQPMLYDFLENGLISPSEITKLDIYPKLVAKIEKQDLDLSKDQELYLEYISKFVLNSKRQAEARILSMLLEEEHIVIPKSEHHLINAADHFAKEIFTKISDEYKYKPILNKISNERYEQTAEFKQAMTTDFKTYLVDIIRVNNEQVKGMDLITNATYTRKEAYKYLLKDFNNGYQVSGYTVFDDMAIMFITLDDTNSFTEYTNKLLTDDLITWYSKANRKLTNKDNRLTQEGVLANNKVPIHIFTKRTSSEEFYYLGLATTQQTKTVQINNKEHIEYTYKLDNPIDNNLYKYLQHKGE